MHQPNTELPVISADAARQPGAPAHRRCSYRIADRVTQWPPVAFQQRARRPGRADTDAEAMLAQLADLEARIAQIGCGPGRRTCSTTSSDRASGATTRRSAASGTVTRSTARRR